MRAHAGWILSLVAGCAASPSRAPAPAPLFGRPATEAMRLVPDEKKGLSLADVVGEYARVTGLIVIWTQDTGQQLGKCSRLAGLSEGVLEVPAGDVEAFFESLLRTYDFALVGVHDGEPRTVQLLSLQTQERNRVRERAAYVPCEELAAQRRHAARIVTTLIRLPAGIDARVLSNSLRTMLVDANTQQIIPVGGGTLILTGFAPDVASFAELLKAIGESGAERSGPAERP
jgi:hypothetical protein